MNIELERTQLMLDWLKTKLYLHTIANRAKTRIVKRGQIYRCNFGHGIGSEMEKDRPSVILQNDIGNLKSPNTIVAPITHDSSTLPCMVPIANMKDDEGKIVLDGCVNISNTVCVSKARLGDYIGILSSAEMKNIDRSIAKTFGIMSYYADIEKKYSKNLKYMEKIKYDRNTAQNMLRDIFLLLNVDNIEDAKRKIIDNEKGVDN